MSGNLDDAVLSWLLDNGTQGVMTTDTDLNVCGWNRWLQARTGLAAGDVVQRNLFELYPELRERRVDQFYQQALAGNVVVLAQRLHHYLLPMPPSVPQPGLSLMQQSARLGPLLVAGQVSGTITIIEDVTERVESENELRAAAQALEQRVAQRTAQLAAATRQLQHLSRRLIEIQENERRAVARELHDEAGQALTTLMLALGALEQRASPLPDVAAGLSGLKDTTAGIMETLHRLAVNLRPASLDRVGLVPALTQLVDSYNQPEQPSIELEIVSLDDVRLPAEVETVLYRVVQEALNNAVRHAHAVHIGILIQRGDGDLLVIIEDDGIGFDVAVAMQRGRLGLLGMRERVEMLGGTLTIESARGSGTTVYARVPSAPAAPAAAVNPLP